jgi:transcriptional antiterminator NusG
VNSDADNTTHSLPAESLESQVPVAPPHTDDLPAARHATQMESVDNEREVGPTDLTGQTDQPPAESSPNAEAPETAAQMPAVQTDAPDKEDLRINRQWYILKVQTNREESIRDALQRRVAMAGLEKYFGDIIVPTEMISEFKGGKKRVSKRKLYPGYIVVNMEINDDTWYLVRETSGIGDFTGAMGRPTPMAPQDVAKIVAKTEEKPDEAPRVDIRFKPGDRVRIKEGTFENFEGNVEAIDQANGRVTVMINIFGRSTPVELEYWQIEAV